MRKICHGAVPRRRTQDYMAVTMTNYRRGIARNRAPNPAARNQLAWQNRRAERRATRQRLLSYTKHERKGKLCEMAVTAQQS